MSGITPIGKNNNLAESDSICTGRLRILVGPLAGLLGTLVERRSPSRVLMAVDSLARGVYIEVDESQLEAVDQHIDKTASKSPTVASVTLPRNVWKPD